MGKYVPGNPTVIVENMTGAGQPDRGESYLQSGEARRPHHRRVQRQSDSRRNWSAGRASISTRARWNGSARRVTTTIFACSARKPESPMPSNGSLRKPVFKLAGSAPGSTTDDVAKVLEGGDRIADALDRGLQRHRRYAGRGRIGRSRRLVRFLLGFGAYDLAQSDRVQSGFDYVAKRAEGPSRSARKFP